MQRLTVDQYRPQQKFVADLLRGLTAAKSVTLYKAAGALHESIETRNTFKRLSRNLKSDRLCLGQIEERYLELAATVLHDEERGPFVIVCDGSDLQKKHPEVPEHGEPYRPRAMPYVDWVRDGDAAPVPVTRDGKTKREQPKGPGYHLATITATDDQNRHVPLLGRLWSPRYRHRSEFAVWAEAIEDARPHVPDHVTWVFDRGFDSKLFFNFLAEQQIRWACRIAANKRVLFVEGVKHRAKDVVLDLRLTHRFRAKKFQKRSKLGKRRARLGWIPDVRLLEHPPGAKAYGRCGDTPYSLVVCWAKSKKEPIAVLTNIRVETAEQAEEVAQAFMRRWAVEEDFRAAKQSFRLEKHLRLLTWRSITRMFAFMTMAFGFASLLFFLAPELAERFVAAALTSAAGATFGKIFAVVSEVFRFSGFKRFLAKLGP